MIDVRFTPKVNGKKEKAYLLLFALIAVVAFIFSLTQVSEFFNGKQCHFSWHTRCSKTRT